MIHRISVTVLVVILLSIAVTALAQEAPAERNSLIQLRSRVFDLGTDVRRMRRDPHVIPITEVRWIADLTDSDTLLGPTVIHIRTFADFPGKSVKWAWPPNENREQYAPAEDLADVWALQNYDVRWRHRVAPSTHGDIYLFPKSSDIEYYVYCAHERKNSVPIFCAADALYPPDPDLRIMIRIYQVTDPLNDFAAIVERAVNLVYCLDVTRALDAGAWQPLKIEGSISLDAFLSTCENISS